MTVKLMNVLIRLYNAKLDDQPFISLAHVYKTTLDCLFERDWIFRSAGVDGVRYKITGRGERAMRVYLRPPKRHDGICPQCGERPKHVRSSGHRDGYCVECLRENARREWGHGLTGRNEGRLCSDCKSHPIRKMPNGTFSTYCEECDRRRKREHSLKSRAERLQRVLAGELVPCRKCLKEGKQTQVYFTETYAYDVCREHYLAYMQGYNDRRRPNNKATVRRKRFGQAVPA